MKNFFSMLPRRIDRMISGGLAGQLVFFACAVAAIFIILFALSAALYPLESGLAGRFWTLVLNFIDVGGYEDTDGVAPQFIFLANILGIVFFGGLLVSFLINIFEQRVEKIRSGEVSYRFRNHAVIAGFDPMAGGLVRQLASARDEIVLQTTEDAELVRRTLAAELDKRCFRKLTVVAGSRTSPEDLQKLNLAECAEFFLFGEAGEADRDSQNIESLARIAEQRAPAAKPLRCHVLFDQQDAFAAFQQQDIAERKYIDFIPFNFHDEWAKKVFVDLSYNGGEIAYVPLDREPLTPDSQKHVHLVILGMSEAGIALAVQAAHICHFPNYFTKGIKTKITFIGDNAPAFAAFLNCRFQSFFDEIEWDCPDEGMDELAADSKKYFTDVVFEFRDARLMRLSGATDGAPRPELLGLLLHETKSYLKKIAKDPDALLTVAVALDDPASCFSAALHLPEEVYRSDAQILVRQEHSYAAFSLLSKKIPGVEYRKYRNVKPFGMYANALDLERDADLLPMMIKYTYDQSAVPDFAEDAVRENWLTNWKDADNVSALKESNRCAADYIPVKVRSLGIKPGVELSDKQVRFAALMEHQRWLTEKLLLGFRPPTPEEASGIAADKKRAYYKERFIHEDIKPYFALGTDENNFEVKKHDINISQALPFMLKARKVPGT